MSVLRSVLAGLLLTGGCSLIGSDYNDLIKTIKTNWPDRKDAVVVCDLELGRFAVADLASATRAAGISLQALNVKTEVDADRARGTINGMRPGFVVLIDSDPILGPQSKYTKSFISKILNIGVPTVSIHADFLKLGGALAVGPKTAGKVIANANLTKSMRLKVPESATLQ